MSSFQVAHLLTVTGWRRARLGERIWPSLFAELRYCSFSSLSSAAISILIFDSDVKSTVVLQILR